MAGTPACRCLYGLTLLIASPLGHRMDTRVLSGLDHRRFRYPMGGQRDHGGRNWRLATHLA